MYQYISNSAKKISKATTKIYVLATLPQEDLQLSAMNVFFCVANTSAYAVGNVAGFVAKQSFCVNALELVRVDLESTISRIASNVFGNFVGNILGRQLSYITAVPMTVFLGNLMWDWIAETTQGLVSLAESIVTYNPKTIISGPPAWLYTAVRIAGAVLGYISNTLFCYNAMPIVKQGSEFILRELLPMILPISFGPLVPFIATCITPTMTFVAGDLVGMAVKKITVTSGHAVLDHFVEVHTVETTPVKC